MSAARSDLCEGSPITQRSAPTRGDLPQPLGPTTPVRPGSIRKSVGSTKDLNPSRRSRVSFMELSVPAAGDGHVAFGHGTAPPTIRAQWLEGSESKSARSQALG